MNNCCNLFVFTEAHLMPLHRPEWRHPDNHAYSSNPFFTTMCTHSCLTYAAFFFHLFFFLFHKRFPVSAFSTSPKAGWVEECQASQNQLKNRTSPANKSSAERTWESERMRRGERKRVRRRSDCVGVSEKRPARGVRTHGHGWGVQSDLVTFP